MKGVLIYLMFFFLSFVLVAQDHSVIERNGVNVIKGQLIAKIKKEHFFTFHKQNFLETPIFFLFQKFGVTSIERKFPNNHSSRNSENSDGLKLVDLSLIYTINYSIDFNEELASRWFFSSGLFEYVEQQVLPELLYTPDDPKIGSQYHISLIQAIEAWDIQKGDTNVVIGIVDTGIDSDHPDIVNNIKRNYNDPIDGIDNDNDGYIDNFTGWDTGGNDNDTEVTGQHGLKVASCAAAVTDNGTHVAGVGFNCKILPVKISNNSGVLMDGYAGVKYAADHGASVINCSWGTTYHTQYGQDIINYATNNKGAVVIAAAGNSAASTYLYPASFENVLSVGGVNSKDEIWRENSTKGSQYNDKIDLVAPSQSIIALNVGGGSGHIGYGTSFAAPIVAGVAALVRSEYPDASPQKVAAILKASTDSIYHILGNESFKGALGTGRVNAFKALLPVLTPFITLHKYNADDGLEQDLAVGDTVVLTVDLKNHLGNADNLSIVLRSEDGKALVIDSLSSISSLNTNEVKTCLAPFKFIVNVGAGINASIEFSLEISDGVHIWEDAFTLSVNKDYIDILTNNLDLSFNNYGRIGYTYTGSGLGVKYKESESLIGEMGVLVAISDTNVLSYEDYELLTFEPAVINSPDALSLSNATFTATGVLVDDWAISPIGLKVQQTAYAWDTPHNENYIIYEYIIRNPTITDFSDVYVGVYSDWNIGDKNSNVTKFDASNNLGYAYEPSGTYAGVKALRTEKVNYYAFDQSGYEGINIADGFNDSEEYQSMTNGISHSNVSGDVANIISNGPYAIGAGDSLIVAFAILANENLEGLSADAEYAELMYEEMRGIELEVNSIKNANCNGSETGEINVDVDLGFPPYTLTWNHDTTITTLNISQLGADVYDLSITDKYGISRAASFTVTEPDSLSVNLISKKEITCINAKDGGVELDVSGGVGEYVFNWNNLAVDSIRNPDLGVGTFTLEVSDSIGCVGVLEVIINSPDSIKVFETNIINDSLNICDGKISLNATGGTAPYMYSLEDGVFKLDSVFSELCGGEYTATVRDANSCIEDIITKVEAPFVVFENFRTDDGNDQNLAIGDTVTLYLDLKNYMDMSSNLNVVLHSADGKVEMIDSLSDLSFLTKGEIKTCYVPFRFVVNSTVSLNSKADFKIDITNGIDVWNDYFEIVINKDYVDVLTNNLDLSFNNYGRIGYTTAGAGKGVIYKDGTSLISEMGVLLAIARNDVLSYEDQELFTLESAVVNTNEILSSTGADFIVSGVLTDDYAVQPKGVTVEQTAYAWDTPNNENYVIYEFVIKNLTEDDLDEIYVGVYSDWDIGDENSNVTGFDVGKDIGYAYEPGGLYGGVKALRTNKVNYYAFDKSGIEGIDISDDFNDAEEYESMTSGIAHVNVSGDVANIISNGPYLVKSADSLVVAFAILAGEDMKSLKTHAQYAELQYEKMRGITIDLDEFENVSCNGVKDGLISLSIDLGFPPYSVEWFHDLSITVPNATNLDSGSYNVSITDKYGISKLMNFTISEPSELVADLISIENTSCTDAKDGNATLDVYGGTGSYYYNWNNSKVPGIETPDLPAGTYVLEVSDIVGCIDTVDVFIGAPDSLKLYKAEIIDDTLNICEGKAVLIASGGVLPYLYSWNEGSIQDDNTFDGLCSGTYEATTIDANGCSQSERFIIEAPEIIEGENRVNEIIQEFKFYPNPADEYIIAEFKLRFEENVTISIVDLNGRLIQRILSEKLDLETYKVILNSSVLKAGNYFMNITSESGSSSHQFEVYH
jgi:serine protease|tara:strand:- start:7227 stop:12545 length:5319 start_codon:yes stop_codon:yes gene_type:complete